MQCGSLGLNNLALQLLQSGSRLMGLPVMEAAIALAILPFILHCKVYGNFKGAIANAVLPFILHSKGHGTCNKTSIRRSH